jgi:hypothetical protein
MSQLVKTKRQANFKDFKRFGAFKGLVEEKNVVINSFHSCFKLAHAKKSPIYNMNSLNKLNAVQKSKKTLFFMTFPITYHSDR